MGQRLASVAYNAEFVRLCPTQGAAFHAGETSLRDRLDALLEASRQIEGENGHEDLALARAIGHLLFQQIRDEEHKIVVAPADTNSAMGRFWDEMLEYIIGDNGSPHLAMALWRAAEDDVDILGLCKALAGMLERESGPKLTAVEVAYGEEQLRSKQPNAVMHDTALLNWAAQRRRCGFAHRALTMLHEPERAQRLAAAVQASDKRLGVFQTDGI
jgi:hypothetical protein